MCQGASLHYVKLILFVNYFMSSGAFGFNIVNDLWFEYFWVIALVPDK